jgi:hypothetical protein
VRHCTKSYRFAVSNYSELQRRSKERFGALVRPEAKSTPENSHRAVSLSNYSHARTESTLWHSAKKSAVSQEKKNKITRK